MQIFGGLGQEPQYTFTPSLGVIVPYANIAAHKEAKDEARMIIAGYGESTSLLPGSGLTFLVPTDPIDDSYFTWSVGFSTVLRGGRERRLDGPITGGLMAFVQYESVEGLEHFEEQIISAGFRYEF